MARSMGSLQNQTLTLNLTLTLILTLILTPTPTLTLTQVARLASLTYAPLATPFPAHCSLARQTRRSKLRCDGSPTSPMGMRHPPPSSNPNLNPNSNPGATDR